jgi:hypothetical protein
MNARVHFLNFIPPCENDSCDAVLVLPLSLDRDSAFVVPHSSFSALSFEVFPYTRLQ